MFIKGVVWVASLLFIAGVIRHYARAAAALKARTMRDTLRRLMRGFSDQASRRVLIRFGTFRRPEKERGVARILLLCLERGSPCYHIRIEKFTDDGRYRCQLSFESPGLGWISEEYQGRIGDDVWTAALPLINSAADIANVIQAATPASPGLPALN